MELNEFKARLKDGRLGGCFIFAGEEDYLKRHYLSELRARVAGDEAFRAFNHAIHEGAEISFASLRDDIESPPMMSDTKLIEWRYPVFDKMRESELGLLEATLDLLEKYEHVTLAFLVADGALELGTPKRESKFERRFGKRIGILNFPVSSDAALISWLKKHFDAEGIAVTVSVLNALLFRSGHSMSVLSDEVTKLSAYAKANGRREINERDVEEVASSTPECDTFALANAVLERNKRLAYAALEEMKSRRVDPTVILGMMARSYSEMCAVSNMLADGMDAADIQAATRLNPYRVRLCISAAKKFTPEKLSNILAELVRVDTGAKYGGVTGYTAIELFIAKCV